MSIKHGTEADRLSGRRDRRRTLPAPESPANAADTPSSTPCAGRNRRNSGPRRVTRFLNAASILVPEASAALASLSATAMVPNAATFGPPPSDMTRDTPFVPSPSPARDDAPVAAPGVATASSAALAFGPDSPVLRPQVPALRPQVPASSQAPATSAPAPAGSAVLAARTAAIAPASAAGSSLLATPAPDSSVLATPAAGSSALTVAAAESSVATVPAADSLVLVPSVADSPVLAAQASDVASAGDEAPVPKKTGWRRWGRLVAVAAILALFAIELVIGWPALSSALSHLNRPQPGWLAAAFVAEMSAMGAYARMQRHLLRSAGVRVPIYRHVALAYAAHSLSVTLPGGPAFSTRFNYQQMRRFGATPAVASWCIALSGILSAAGLAVVTAGGTLSASGIPDWLTFAKLGLGLVLFTVGIRYLTRHPEKLERVARAVLSRFNLLRNRPAEQGIDKGIDRFRGFVTQLRAARLSPGHATAAAAHAVLNWLFDAACLWMCFQAVSGTSVRSTQLLLAYCAGMAAGTITIIPGGLGIIDSALILGLVTGGSDTATAVAAVVLYRLISFGFIIGTGWITWLVIRHRHPNPVPNADDLPSSAESRTALPEHATADGLSLAAAGLLSATEGYATSPELPAAADLAASAEPQAPADLATPAPAAEKLTTPA